MPPAAPPIRRFGPLILAALAVLWLSRPAAALPVQDAPIFSSSSKDNSLPSLEVQERAPRVPETRIGGLGLSGANLHPARGRLERDCIRVLELPRGELALDRFIGMDEPVERTRADGVHETLLTDNLMTALAAYDNTGAVVRSTEYTAYGMVRGGAEPGAVGFHGARQLGKTGLYYLRNRVYAPELGRFISRDPIGFRGGRNLHRAFGGGPTRSRDPLGLLVFTSGGPAMDRLMAMVMSTSVGSDAYARLNVHDFRVHINYFSGTLVPPPERNTPSDVVTDDVIDQQTTPVTLDPADAIVVWAKRPFDTKWAHTVPVPGSGGQKWIGADISVFGGTPDVKRRLLLLGKHPLPNDQFPGRNCVQSIRDSFVEDDNNDDLILAAALVHEMWHAVSFKGGGSQELQNRNHDFFYEKEARFYAEWEQAWGRSRR